VISLLAIQNNVSSFVVPPAEHRSVNLPASTIEAETDVEAETNQVDFPPPLSRIDRLKRAATFWSVAVPIVANYYGKFAEMKIREGLLGEEMSEEEVEVCNVHAKFHDSKRYMGSHH